MHWQVLYLARLSSIRGDYLAISFASADEYHRFEFSLACGSPDHRIGFYACNNLLSTAQSLLLGINPNTYLTCIIFNDITILYYYNI